MRRIACCTLLFLFATATFAHHGPDKVTIDAAKQKQPAVTFSHVNHATKLVKSCDTCHHLNKGMTADKPMKVAKCASCHLDPKGAVPGMREMGNKNPFHSLCIDCHKSGKKGPTLCKDCHAK